MTSPTPINAFRTSAETNDLVREWWHRFANDNGGTKQCTQDVIILAAVRVAGRHRGEFADAVADIVATRYPQE